MMKGSSSKLPSKRCQPRAPKTNRRRHIHPVDPHACGMECRYDQPKNINEAHAEDCCGYYRKQASTALKVSREEQEEWQREVKENQPQPDSSPPARQAVHVPDVLFRQVAGPDEQILSKCHIGPEHDERQQEVAEVVKMGR